MMMVDSMPETNTVVQLKIIFPRKRCIARLGKQ